MSGTDGKTALKGHEAEALAKYASMSPESLDAELKRFGIDPNPTIATVKDLVQAKLEELRAPATETLQPSAGRVPRTGVEPATS